MDKRIVADSLTELYNFKVNKIKVIIASGAILILLPNLVFAATTTETVVKPIGRQRAATWAEFVPKEGDFASAVVLDYKTKGVLYSYKPDIAWPAASLTKLMGALVFLDRKFNWGTTVSIKAQDEVGGGRLRVASGAKMSIKDMLYSSIVGSANNAATALARISGLGMNNFVAAMNIKAKALGCKYTAYKDASGMNTGNTTTASDMAKIALAAFAKPEIRKPASTSSYKFKILNTGELKTIKNTNKLLIDENNGLYVTGGKTGYLEESKNNLVLKVRPSAKEINKEILIVVFGAETRDQLFDAASRLAQWSWISYTWPK